MFLDTNNKDIENKCGWQTVTVIHIHRRYKFYRFQLPYIPIDTKRLWKIIKEYKRNEERFEEENKVIKIRYLCRNLSAFKYKK